MSYVRSSIHFSLNTDVNEDYPKQARSARGGHKNTPTRKSVTEAKSLVFTPAMSFENSLQGRKKFAFFFFSPQAANEEKNPVKSSNREF